LRGEGWGSEGERERKRERERERKKREKRGRERDVFQTKSKGGFKALKWGLIHHTKKHCSQQYQN
jgi:hypothetical protein